MMDLLLASIFVVLFPIILYVLVAGILRVFR